MASVSSLASVASRRANPFAASVDQHTSQINTHSHVDPYSAMLASQPDDDPSSSPVPEAHATPPVLEKHTESAGREPSPQASGVPDCVTMTELHADMLSFDSDDDDAPQLALTGTTARFTRGDVAASARSQPPRIATAPSMQTHQPPPPSTHPPKAIQDERVPALEAQLMTLSSQIDDLARENEAFRQQLQHHHTSSSPSTPLAVAAQYLCGDTKVYINGCTFIYDQVLVQTLALEQFRALRDKLRLLDHAVALHHGPLITKVLGCPSPHVY